MNWDEFELGFWHPFGEHGRESALDIIHRKRREIEKNGWTLWSFQYRTPTTLCDWCRELSAAKSSDPIVVFCSRGDSTVDPDRPGSQTKTSDCRQYKFVAGNDTSLRPIPSAIRVPHPFKPGKAVASAFVVRRVHHPVKPFERPVIEWFSQGKWRKDKLPTRPEYLIRRGGNSAMRDVSAVLELQPPYLAVVKL